MNHVFDYKDYREFLRSLVQNRQIRGKTQVELAKAMNCQAAYLSQVLGDRAELTEDHGMKLCIYLEFNDAETEYFLLILRISRAGTKPLLSYLEQQRDRLQQLHHELSSRISSEKNEETNELNIYYCSSWIPSVIHTATSCETLQTSVAIAQRFRLEKGLVEYHLQILEKYLLVSFQEHRWVFQGRSTHFTKNSALDQIFQLSRRMLALNSLSNRLPQDIHYSVVFSANQETVNRIRDLLFDSIEKMHKQVEPSPSEDVYSACIDLFRA